MNRAMTWEDFYLICFLVGFALSLLAVLPQHLHIPHVHVPHVHLPHGGGGGGSQVPVISFPTLAAFLAWFGGTGYLLVRFSSIWLFLALGIAIAGGLVGASIVFLFLAKVLMRTDEDLDPADYDMVGVLGQLSLPIRKNGTGEIVFTQGGTRHVVGARSEDDNEIGKGVEVVVTRFEKGIAYVRPWSEMAGEENL
jgi:membrane protein implicated in regulation of membrane protease activity